MNHPSTRKKYYYLKKNTTEIFILKVEIIQSEL